LGWTQKEIGELLGVAQRTVSDDLSRNCETAKNAIRDLASQHIERHEIARRFNLPPVLVEAITLEGLDDAERDYTPAPERRGGLGAVRGYWGLLGTTMKGQVCQTTQLRALVANATPGQVYNFVHLLNVPKSTVHDDVSEIRHLHRRHLTREQRREVVAKLRAQGWSLRRIASVLGVTDPTILNDLRALGAKNLAPATVTGADGKQYPATKSMPVVEPTQASEAEAPALS
jgi:predicted transcriptional regulator